MGTPHYESDNATWNADAYTANDWAGVAWYVLGWETSPIAVWTCQDCDAAGWERDGGGGGVYDKGSRDCDHARIAWNEEPETERTGNVVAVMVGDDRRFAFEPSELTPLPREAYCGSCGQIGCTHDGLSRE